MKRPLQIRGGNRRSPLAKRKTEPSQGGLSAANSQNYSPKAIQGSPGIRTIGSVRLSSWICNSPKAASQLKIPADSLKLPADLLKIPADSLKKARSQLRKARSEEVRARKQKELRGTVPTTVVTRLRPTAFILARSAVVGETLTRRRGSRRPTTRPAGRVARPARPPPRSNLFAPRSSLFAPRGGQRFEG